MTDRTPERSLARAGIFLVLLALLTGLAMPGFANPRQGLAAHVSGVMSGLLLVALSAVWGQLVLSAAQRRLALALAVGGTYANWVSSCLAAAWGTSRLTPLAGSGFAAAPWQETLVQVLQVSQAIALLLALGLVVFGLRRAVSSS